MNTKHKKYKLLYSHDTYSFVLDLISETEHKCFYLNHKAGDEFYLFEKGENIWTGNKLFEYSVLNLYKVGEKYVFDIINVKDKVLVVSNFPGLSFAVPKSFSDHNNQDSIELEIEDLDLENNRLRFKKTQKDINSQTLDYSVFEPNKLYSLPVIKTYINKNNNLFAIVEYNKQKYHVSIPSFIKEDDLGANLDVFLTYYLESNAPTLKVTRAYLISRLYKVGQKYSFVIDKRINDVENGIVNWILRDAYNMHHKYYPTNDLSFTEDLLTLVEGDEVDLCVIRISDKGYLDLVKEVLYWDQKNYLVEDVFEKIGFPDQEDKYFFRDKLYLEENDEEDSQNERSYIDQYNDGENLWVFSYLKYLDGEILKTLESGIYEEAITLINIYINIEKWILEGSDYLRNFSDFKRQDIIKKAESKIEKLNAKKKAIELYINGQEQTFLEEVTTILSRSPYLDRVKKNVLKELVILSQYFTVDTDKNLYEAILLLIKNNFIREDERRIFSFSIESKVNRLKEQVIEEHTTIAEAQKQELEYIVSNQYLVVCLHSYSPNNINACISSIHLLKYLALYYNDIRYLDLAIQIILSNSYLRPNISKYNDVLKISFDELKRMIIKGESNNFVYGKSGLVSFQNHQLNFLPKNLNRLDFKEYKYPVLNNYEGFALSVLSSYKLPQIDTQLSEPKLIKDLLYIINYKKSISNESISFNPDKIYKGKIKDIGKESSYCFISFLLDGEIRDALLHINSFHKCRAFERIDDILKPNDYVRFKIVSVQDDKIINIVPNEILEHFVEEFCLSKGGYETNGEVIKIFKDKTFIITKEGWPVRVFNSDFQVGANVKLKVTDYDRDNHVFVAAEIYEDSISLEQNPKKLFRSFLKRVGIIENKKIAHQDLTKDEYDLLDIIELNELNVQFNNNLKLITNQLILCLEQRLSLIDNIKDIAIHYFLINIISSILKNGKSYIYYNKIIELSKIIEFSYPEEFESFSVPEPIELENSYPFSNNNDIVYQLLGYLNTTVKDIPLEIDSSSNLYLLKKLIESYNLFYEIDKETPMLNHLKKIISTQLRNLYINNRDDISQKLKTILRESFSQDIQGIEHYNDNKLITNLGSESQTKEFKSSLFFSASEEAQAKIILKTICGFLNAYGSGGSLYIGVNDSGDIIGLKDDLNYNAKIATLDQYLNHLQSLIAGAFPKEINALLEYKFHKVGKLDYLEVVIPSHDKPIPYENEFYQRQGVQTRILKGTDLIDFIKRKSTSTNVKLYDKDKKVGIENEPEIGIPQSYDFFEHLKQEGETKECEMDAISPILAFLYILEDNTYILTKEDNSYPNYLFKVKITEKYKYGCLLLCYDNACVNRIEIRSILSKSFYKKYMNATSDQGKLMAVYQSLPSDEIAISIKRFNRTYLKIYEVDRISEHRIIGLKGNCIVQEDFDQVLNYYVTQNLTSEFDTFRRQSRQGLGAEIEINSALYKSFKTFLEQNPIVV